MKFTNMKKLFIILLFVTCTKEIDSGTITISDIKTEISIPAPRNFRLNWNHADYMPTEYKYSINNITSTTNISDNIILNDFDFDTYQLDIEDNNDNRFVKLSGSAEFIHNTENTDVPITLTTSNTFLLIVQGNFPNDTYIENTQNKVITNHETYVYGYYTLSDLPINIKYKAFDFDPFTSITFIRTENFIVTDEFITQGNQVYRLDFSLTLLVQ